MLLFWYHCWVDNEHSLHVDIADYAEEGFIRSLREFDEGLWVKLPLEGINFETILRVKIIVSVLGLVMFGDVNLDLPLSVMDLLNPEAIKGFVI